MHVRLEDIKETAIHEAVTEYLQREINLWELQLYHVRHRSEGSSGSMTMQRVDSAQELDWVVYFLAGNLQPAAVRIVASLFGSTVGISAADPRCLAVPPVN